MRTFRCACQNQIYFDNSQCIACGRELGFCPACRQLTTLVAAADGGFVCGNASCGARLTKCLNYSEHNVCNRCVLASESRLRTLCDCCRFNETIPDLTVPGNLEKWGRLEAAKRRLFYDLALLGLPYGTATDGISPSLRFDFKADVIPTADFWRPIGKAERVYTGYAAGRITINIREADDVEREKLRVHLGEAQRTLIGHFRHEIGHFYWDMLVKGRREQECQAVFGDHQLAYTGALDSYYKNGPPTNWSERYISAYATMHPWEDFAETWGAYLDMVSALDTADNVGFGGQTDPVHADAYSMICRYQQLGIAFNEISRSFGLVDVVTELFVPPVVAKLKFIHGLVQQVRAENGALQPSSK